MKTLKLGVVGEDVKTLQEFLGISQDGIFGLNTEIAVKKWQSENGLTADGIVGPKTINMMGLLETDLTTSEVLSFPLDIKKSFLPPTEYFAGPTKKRWIYLHHTAGWHNPFNTISAWGKDNRGQIATEFVLGGQSITGKDNSQDGILVQSFPAGGYGWHLGTGSRSMHTQSVGIEICNFGYLTKAGYHKAGKWVALEKESYYTYVGTKADLSQIVTLPQVFRGHKTWHRYSDTQIKVLKDWILYIAQRDSIDVRKGIVEEVRKNGAKAFDLFNLPLCEKTPGMWLHTNVRKDKVDLFPQPEILEMLLSL